MPKLWTEFRNIENGIKLNVSNCKYMYFELIQSGIKVSQNAI